jgi:hypothetical protein
MKFKLLFTREAIDYSISERIRYNRNQIQCALSSMRICKIRNIDLNVSAYNSLQDNLGGINLRAPYNLRVPYPRVIRCTYARVLLHVQKDEMNKKSASLARNETRASCHLPTTSFLRNACILHTPDNLYAISEIIVSHC